MLDGVELETGVREQDGGSSRNSEGVKEEGRGQRRSDLKSSEPEEHFTLEEVEEVTSLHSDQDASNQITILKSVLILEQQPVV